MLETQRYELILAVNDGLSLHGAGAVRGIWAEHEPGIVLKHPGNLSENSGIHFLRGENVNIAIQD